MCDDTYNDRIDLVRPDWSRGSYLWGPVAVVDLHIAERPAFTYQIAEMQDINPPCCVEVQRRLKPITAQLLAPTQVVNAELTRQR